MMSIMHLIPYQKIHMVQHMGNIDEKLEFTFEQIQNFKRIKI